VPKVYFHLCDHSDFLLDEQGSTLDLSRIPDHALRAAREIIADDALSGRINMGYSIEVRDEAGKAVHTLFFKDAVAISGLE
jgi:hypothetical protein